MGAISGGSDTRGLVGAIVDADADVAMVALGGVLWTQRSVTGTGTGI